jgi:hypothetical protein
MRTLNTAHTQSAFCYALPYPWSMVSLSVSVRDRDGAIGHAAVMAALRQAWVAVDEQFS